MYRNSGDVITVQDSLFLLSEYEISGFTGAIGGSKETPRYSDYYPYGTSGNALRIKNYNGVAIAWWTRSYDKGYTYRPVTVTTSGTFTGNNDDNTTLGVSFAFCV